MAVSVPTLKEANHSTANSASYNTGVITWSANDLIILIISNMQSFGAVEPNTPTATGLTFTRIAGAVDVNALALTAWWAHAASGGSSAINITYSGAQGNCNWSISKVTGYNSVTPIATSATDKSNNTNGTDLSVVNATIFGTGSLLFAAGVSGVQTTTTCELTELSDHAFFDGSLGNHSQTLATMYSASSNISPTFSWGLTDPNRVAITFEIRQANIIPTPGTATLVLTTFAPVAAAGRRIIAGLASLTITPFAPTVTRTLNVRSDTQTAHLVLTSYAPRTIIRLEVAYALEVDWDFDDDFNDAHEELITDDIVYTIDSLVGRDYPSQLIGRSVAGKLRAQLNNSSGIFSSFNTSSPLFGMLLPGRKVRLRTIAPAPVLTTLWTGFLSGPPMPAVSAGTLPKATLEAQGPLAIISKAKISPPAMEYARTGEIINAILDAAGWSATARQIDDGEVILNHWFVSPNKGALEALQEIAEAEGGAIREGTNWDIIFESRYNRVANSVSKATFDDIGIELGYHEISQEDPLRHVYNDVEIVVQPMEIGEVETLWELDEPFTLLPGQSVTFIATIGNDIEYVKFWSTPLLDDDVITSGGTASISTSKTATTMFITVTNTHASETLSGSSIQARGLPVRKLNAFRVTASDLTSQELYGKRSFPFPSPWFPNGAYAQAAADYTIAQYKDPVPIVTQGHKLSDFSTFTNSIRRELSDRITQRATSNQTQLGVNRDFYIESINHVINLKAFHKVIYTLSPAYENPGYFIIGTSALNGTEGLAY